MHGIGSVSSIFTPVPGGDLKGLDSFPCRVWRAFCEGISKKDAGPSPSAPFYQRKYQAIWVACGVVRDLFAAFGCKMWALGSSALRFKSEAYRVHQLSFSFLRRAVTRFVAFFLTPGKVVHFSQNEASLPRPYLEAGVSEYDELKKRYGPLFEKMIASSSLKAYPPDVMKLKIQPLFIEGGLCFGSCLYFASRALKGFDDAADWRREIERVASVFEKTVPDEAQIAQLISDALPWRSICVKVSDELEMSGLTNLLSESAISCGSTEEGKALAHLRRAILNEPWRRARQVVARSFGITLDYVDTLVPKEGTDFATHVDNSLRSLSPGIYHCILRMKSGVGHSMLYIKETQERAYLFDPNFATILIGGEQESAAALKSFFSPRPLVGYFASYETKKCTIERCERMRMTDDPEQEDANYLLSLMARGPLRRFMANDPGMLSQTR